MKKLEINRFDNINKATRKALGYAPCFFIHNEVRVEVYPDDSFRDVKDRWRLAINNKNATESKDSLKGYRKLIKDKKYQSLGLAIGYVIAYEKRPMTFTIREYTEIEFSIVSDICKQLDKMEKEQNMIGNTFFRCNTLQLLIVEELKKKYGDSN